MNRSTKLAASALGVVAGAALCLPGVHRDAAAASSRRGAGEIARPDTMREAREPVMTRERMEAIVQSVGSELKGEPGAIEFVFLGVAMVCLSDVRHDRMRIIAPVVEASRLEGEQVARILEANFHTALDARYATSRGILYVAYIHPLGALTEPMVRSALEQVANLRLTFGSTYSSGVLRYGESAIR